MSRLGAGGVSIATELCWLAARAFQRAALTGAERSFT